MNDFVFSCSRDRPDSMITQTPQGITLEVRVVTRSGRSGIAGARGGALLVRLNAPPVDGAANRELIELMAKALGVSRSAVSLVTGQRSRQKRVAISGIDATTAKARLQI